MFRNFGEVFEELWSNGPQNQFQSVETQAAKSSLRMLRVVHISLYFRNAHNYLRVLGSPNPRTILRGRGCKGVAKQRE